jgi:hypothetical protein
MHTDSDLTRFNLQCVRKVTVGFQAPTLSGPDTLVFIFLGVNEADIYSIRIHDIKHTKQQIRQAAASVTPDVLDRVWHEMEYRLDVCISSNESLTELRQTCGKTYFSCSLI